MIQSWVYWISLFIGSLVFWILPKSIRYGFLGILSFGVLFSFDQVSSLLLLGLCVGVFLLTPYFKRAFRYSQWITGFSIFICLIPLAYFKYTQDLFPQLAGQGWVPLIIPLGISYYVFKLIHYILESRAETLPQSSFQLFFSYLFLFPAFSAGPIQRFDIFLEQKENHWNSQIIVQGITRITYGLIKQFFLIQRVLGHFNYRMQLPEMTDGISHTLSFYSTTQIWALLLSKYIYIYLNFSAYSDIAIGCCQLWGIKMMENFNFPILASSINEFWRRWHMSLSQWCQNYIFLPVLARSRTPWLALYASFFSIALWHAATPSRIAWGLFYATGVYLSTLLTRKMRKKSKSSQFSKKNKVYELPFLQKAGGFLITQLFVILSMSFILDDTDSSLELPYKIFLKLIHLD